MGNLSEEAVCFTAGGFVLEGRLLLPEALAGAAVLCHPHPQYGGTMENTVVRALARALAAERIATLRFNFRGVGASEGRYGGGDGEAVDARAAVAFLHARLPIAQAALAGYSFGAAVALAAGHDAPEVSRLVAIAPPITMVDLAFLRACPKPKLFVAGDADPYCPFETLEREVAALAEPKALVRVPHADHFFAGREAVAVEAVVRFLRDG